MLKRLFMVVLSGLLFSVPMKLMAQETNNTQDEQAIRSTATLYREAFNRGDAQALAALYAENGENIDQTGFLLRGRESITKAFEKFFAQHQGAKIEINIQAIDFPQPNLAVETGITQTIAPDTTAPVGSQYTATHVKQDGKWLLHSVHEASPPPPSNYQQMKELAWLIGNWVDEEVPTDKTSKSSALVIHIMCHWSANRNFLVRKFTATLDNQIVTTGMQHIAWYAPTKSIRSWTFDSNGSITVGEWSKKGDQWEVKSTETLRTGKTATETEIFTRDNAHTYTWQIVDQTFDGKPQPNVAGKVRRLYN
ncbi:MAG: hypothetical protein DRR06_12945 [Gammaproteobacteria bacterium]|nr:MAG: hypothetical protein DRR06_12945 [Gammaproteobacteria bacterium]